jgi:hypothetical protein
MASTRSVVSARLDAIARVRFELLLLEADRVRGRRERRDAIEPRRIGDDELLALQVGGRRRDDDVGDRLLGLGVDDGARQDAHALLRQRRLRREPQGGGHCANQPTPERPL